MKEFRLAKDMMIVVIVLKFFKVVENAGILNVKDIQGFSSEMARNCNVELNL